MRSQAVSRLFLLLLSFATQAASAADAAPGPTEDAALWRLQWANDIFLDSDNQFTNGFTLQLHSQARSSLAATGGTPAFGKALAKLVLPRGDELWFREGWALGHNMQTPQDIERAELIPTDVPYVGMLGWANSYVAFNDRELTGFELMLGVVGPVTQSEEIQTFVHDLSGDPEPQGWDNQLENEPLLNLYYMKKRKFWSARNFDAAWNLDGALGNFFTFGQASLEMRLGRVPPGFAFVPTPIGRGIDYDARLPEQGASYFYASLVLRGTLFLHALPREGNTFRNDNAWTEQNLVSMERTVGQAVLGIHWERPSWAVHLNYWISTNTLDSASVSQPVDLANSFGAVTFEWKFH
ncbi:MAG: lipid A deacylase LpxR family protein [Xanthomonadales bacterium]|nr:lipid A deacylase LpxR family protein [Xanthomonadales bacterium]